MATDADLLERLADRIARERFDIGRSGDTYLTRVDRIDAGLLGCGR